MTSISAREIALKVLIEYPGRAKPEDLLQDYLSRYPLERRERAFATQIVSGAIKWRRRLDFVIKSLSHRKRVASQVALNALRLSLYQLMFLDRVPEYSAANEGVSLVKKYGSSFEADYVNAILRRYLREKDSIEFPSIQKDVVTHIGVVYSLPDWLVRRWLQRYTQEEVIRLAEACNRSPEVGLRVNLLRATPDEVRDMLEQEGAEVTRQSFAGLPHLYVSGVSPLENVKAYQLGLVQVQDAAATIVGNVVAPSQGSVVVDLCSAPGGKVTHLYEIVKGRGTVVASDISMARLKDVRINAERLGHTHMRYVVCDARNPCFKDADFVLVDAPCTGLGVLARRWDLRWRKKESDIKRMASVQKQILANAITVAKRGAIIVYSTCSIEPEENQEVVKEVITGCGGVDLVDIDGLVPDEVIVDFGMMQTMPHIQGVDGMFAARLRKR